MLLSTADVLPALYFNSSVPLLKTVCYIEPMLISDTTVLRARSLRRGLSTVVTANMLEDILYYAVVCLTTDPDNLWNPANMYAAGRVDRKL